MRREPGSGSTMLGAAVENDGMRFSVWSESAHSIAVCLFDENGDEELHRIALDRGEGGLHSIFVPGLRPGQRYGLRADGDYDPDQGRWFDPDKLLVDPHAVELDRPFAYDPALAALRGEGGDTAGLVPKAVARAPLPEIAYQPALWRDGGLIYELAVRSFTMRHPDIAPELRGTVAALAEPAVLDHLRKIGVTAVELMPVTAWIDERHLPPLGLTNAWGYNPGTFMALDPRLAPGGMPELAQTVDRLHQAGIGVILDVVFNHTGESDEFGPTLSLRGLDARAYFRYRDEGGRMRLVNDTGTGNTLACDHPATRRLVLDSLRHFVRHAGVDGFRFDLAPVLGRTEHGFDPDAPLLRMMIDDPILGDRVLIAEPWDVGPDGYQLGNFPEPFMEWNDRYRDDIRRFWRGDAGTLGALATRLSGSSDVFGQEGSNTRTVNFIAAHDGMTLADLVAYEQKHNEANGEDNRDGHNENFLWNNGAEGETGDPAVRAARQRDIRALLATLFASRGAIMLTAGDEFGRSQRGNNNAYAQDNELTWLDWVDRDTELEGFVAALSALRAEVPQLGDTAFLCASDGDGADGVRWLRPDGATMSVADWEQPEGRCLCMVLDGLEPDAHLAMLMNGSEAAVAFTLPPEIGDTEAASEDLGGDVTDAGIVVLARSIAFRRTRRV